jgi:ubiquinone/menaquinone biosynthesis C-methylase UbiE
LGIGKEGMKGKRVLNVGAGLSDLGKELPDSSVIDIDLNPGAANTRLSLQDVLYEKLSMREPRKFIVGDARYLPFKDNEFDVVLALQSTYRILNDSSRLKAFRELLRVGKNIHIGPVFGKDFDMLLTESKYAGAEIVVCHPFLHDNKIKMPVQALVQKENFHIQNPDEDYINYIHTYSKAERIKRPLWEEPKFMLPNNVSRTVTVKYDGGSFIVLTK